MEAQERSRPAGEVLSKLMASGGASRPSQFECAICHIAIENPSRDAIRLHLKRFHPGMNWEDIMYAADDDRMKAFLAGRESRTPS